MARNPISSGQNKNMRPLFNSNRGIVTIDKWSPNFMLTNRIVRNSCLGVVAPKNHSNYTPITIKKWSQIMLTTSTITKLDSFKYFEPFSSSGL